MKSNYFLTRNIFTVVISPEDINLSNLGVEFLNILKEKDKSNVVFDMAQFDVITSDDIKFIQSLVDMFKLNNIKVVVCNFNPYSASILFYFIDDVIFETALDVQSAIDVLKN